MGRVAGPIWILFGSVAVVLLIACANVGNLFLVRGGAAAAGAGRPPRHRRRPAAALPRADHRGARRRPARGGARHGAGLGQRAAVPQVRAARRASHRRRRRCAGARCSSPASRRRSRHSSAAGCPALRASEPSLDRLRDGSRGSTARRHWARDGLVVAQTALALVLLTGSALLFRSFQKMRNVDPGYDTRDIFTFQIAPEGEQLNDARSFARFHLAFMERLAHLPGVESVGIVDNVPLNEGLSDAPVPPGRAGGRDRPGRAAGLHLGRGRLLLDHGDPAARGPGVHRGGPAHRPGARDRQPVGGEPALAGAVSRSGGGSSGRRSPSGRPSSAWWKT